MKVQNSATHAKTRSTYRLNLIANARLFIDADIICELTINRHLLALFYSNSSILGMNNHKNIMNLVALPLLVLSSSWTIIWRLKRRHKEALLCKWICECIEAQTIFHLSFCCFVAWKIRKIGEREKMKAFKGREEALMEG